MGELVTGRRLAVAALLCAVFILSLGSAALAANTGPATWSGVTPAEGSTVGVVRPLITATATDAKGLAGSPYYSAKLDGGTQSVTMSRGSANQITLSFTPRVDLANGSHTIYMSVKNNAGVYSTNTWTFMVSSAPKPSAPSPAPGSTVTTTSPLISVAVGGNTTGLTSTVLLDGHTVPSTWNASTGLVTAQTSGIANDASHDVTVTVTNGSGATAKLDWSFSVQVYAPMVVPAQDCVTCHPGFPAAHPMDSCNGCHGVGSPIGEGWNTPDYGPHSYTYIAATPTSCIDCHSAGYSTVPSMHGFAPVATYHDSASACSPCHVKSLTTEHNRYGLSCLTCHASVDPAVNLAIATGNTNCEACHPGAASHTTVHETPVMAGCSGAGCHSGTALTNIHDPAKVSCNTCHKSTDERVVAAIAGRVKTCDACHDATGHGPAHDSAVTPSCAGTGCHGTAANLVTIHVNADGKYTCATCHDSADSKVTGAITAGDKSCTTCHATDIHASLHSAPTSAAACGSAGCHGSLDVLALHAGSAQGPCAVCHLNATKGNLTVGKASADCAGCHMTSGVDYHVSMSVHKAPASSQCAECHHSWGGNPIQGPDVTRHSSGCKTCHTGAVLPATTDCANCHTTEGGQTGLPASFHAIQPAVHTPTDTGSLACQRCHKTTDVRALHTTNGCDTCHVTKGCTECHSMHGVNSGPGLTIKTTCANCHKVEGTSYHKTLNPAHTYGSMDSSCLQCHSSDVRTVHASIVGTGSANPQYPDSCGLCHTNTDPSRIPAGATASCSSCHASYHAGQAAKHALPASPSCVSAGCHDAGSTAVFEGKTVDQIHSSASTTTVGGQTLTSCQVCHAAGRPPLTTNCGTAGCHPDRLLAHGYESAKHLAAPASNDIAILGTTYQLDCVTCHATLELGPIHMAPAGTATCSSCHATLVKQLSTAPETGWNKGCVQAGCHAAAGPNPMHPTIDGDHTRTTGGASDGCFVEGCHTGGGSLAAIHAPKQGCVTCHGAGKTPTADCAASGCHNMNDPHQNNGSLHAGADAYSTIGATHGDSVGMSCSDCHTMQILPLHANYCALCHSSTARAEVKSAIASGSTQCTSCHPGQHADNDHSDLYDAGDWSCGPCHGNGCTQCHSAWVPNPAPVTTSDAKTSYINDATINLTATDGVSGSFGIKNTYYSLDGAPAVIGTQITIPAPATGSVNHTLSFWSTDWGGKTETVNTVLIAVSADMIPPTTTSDVVAAKTYAGDQTFTLTATDANSAVAGTWWQLDSTTGAWNAGTSVLVREPYAGTANHTLYFYSRDSMGNTEQTRSVNFSVLAGKDYSYTGANQSFVVPSGVTTVAVTLNGGAGGRNYWGTPLLSGGNGGRVTSILTVSPGQTLTVRVGGLGMDYVYGGDGKVHTIGAWPNGGNGGVGNTSMGGGAGGGSSSILSGASVVAEAGGGGGAGSSAGGAGGSQGTVPGGNQVGGNGYITGGGGGGGWNAGTPGIWTGVGANGGRGGTGGTSYVVSGTNTVLTSGANTGAGSVTIRYGGVKPGPFTLTYTAGSNGSISGTSPQTVAKGASGSAVTAVANTAYHFVSWSDGSTSNPRTDANVMDDKSVSASFAINTYTLNYSAGAGGTISGTASQTVNYNSAGTTVTAVANTGYHFTGWSDGVSSASRTETSVTANKAVTANFAINTYSLNYSAGTGGTISGAASQTVNHNGSGTAVTAVASNGYHFTGWSDGVSTATRTDSGVTANKSVTASFAVTVYYSLTYTAGTGGTVSGNASQAVQSGSSGTAVTALADSGYYFTGWSDGVSTASRTETNVLADKAVTANFAVDSGGTTAATTLRADGTAWMDADLGASGPYGSWSIYADGKLIGVKDAGDGTTTWNCPQTAVTSGARIDIVQSVGFSYLPAVYDSNSSITYTTYLPPGSTRLEAATWTGFTQVRDDYGYDGYDWGYPNSDYHYVALDAATIGNISFHTTLSSYRVAYVAGTGGTISGTTPQSVISGQSGSAVTAVPNATYHFLNWSDGLATATRTDANVSANQTYTANFVPNVYYTLTYTAGANGTISGTSSQSVVASGTGTAVTAVASTGYHFVNWSDGVATATRTDSNVVADKSVTANFAINTYSLKYTAGTGGTISGTASQTVDYQGSGTAVTAVPDAGQQFVSWSDGVTTATRTDTNVTANKAVSANFTFTYTKGSRISATGAAQYFAVPAGVTQVTVDLYGGQGTPSGTTGQIGGRGGYLKANIAVTPGQLLVLKVGKAGSGLVGGWGGGSGGTGTNASGGGGSTSIGTTGTVLAEAAGGGGAGIGNGGDGGAWSASVVGGNAAGAGTNWCGGGGGWTGGASSKYGGDGGTSRTSSGTYITCTVAGAVNGGDGYMSMTWTDAVTYTLTYTAGSNGTISGTSPQTVASGGSGSAVAAVANTGYRFANWSDGSTANPRTDTNVVANKSVTANFAIQTYQLKYTAGTGGTISGVASQTVNYNASGTAVTAVANTGYTFSGWSDGVSAPSRTDANVVANKSVTANFTPNSYTLTYAAGAGGTLSGTTPQTVTYGSSGTAVTAVADTGYYFTGWSDGVNTLSRTDTNVVASKSVTANFAVDTGGSTGATTFAVNGTAWMDADWNSSGAWGSWSIYADGVLIGTKSADDGTTTWNCPRTTVSSGARIDIVQSVGFGYSPEVYDQASPLTYTFYLPAGSNRLEAATWTGFTSTRSDYGYDGYDWGYPQNEYHYVALDGATIGNVVYHTTLASYSLNYNAGANGTVSGVTSQTVVAGGSGTAVTAVANTGYHFVNWSDGSTANPRTDANASANTSVTANFAINTYTVNYGGTAGGTISGTTPQTIAYGSSGTTVTAVPNAGYHFVNWNDGVTSASRRETNVSASKTLVASFAQDVTYTLAYTAGSNGTISGSTSQTVGSGGSGTAVTAVANTGYHFANWSDGSTANPRTDTNVTANKSVTASFAIDTYTLSYAAGANGTLSGAASQTVNYNASGTAVTAVANSGYHFVNWSDGSTANPRTDTAVTANKSVTANFALVTDMTAPSTSSNALAAYAGAATITLSASDPAPSSGLAGTWYQLDGGSWTAGTSVTVSAPATATVHTLKWYSKDAAGNQETTKTATFDVRPASDTATVSFMWEPASSGNWAYLRVLDENNNVIGSTYVEGSGTGLDWSMTVPAGHMYHLDAYDWYDSDTDYEGSSYQDTGILTTGQNWAFWY